MCFNIFELLAVQLIFTKMACGITARIFVARFHKQITEKSTTTVEEQSEAVQEFYMVSVHQG